MQSHSSRHEVSEHLCDRHPCSPEPFPKGPIQGEISRAYGDRCMPKLIEVMQLDNEELSSEDRLHCLRLFTSLLSTQELKAAAVAGGAVPALLSLLGDPSSSQQLCQLCCGALASCCQLRQGREALVAAGGLHVLVAQLGPSPDAAVAVLQVLSSCADGRAALAASPAAVVPSLVHLMGAAATTYEAAAAAADTLAGIATSDGGILSCLQCGAPHSLVQLAARVLKHPLLSPEGQPQQLLLAVLGAATAALQQISRSPEGKAVIREAGGIEVLAKALQAPDPRSRAGAAAALAGVSVEVASKVPVMAAAGEGLVKLLQQEKPQQQDQAVAAAARLALLNAVEHLDARRKLELMLSKAEVSHLLGPLPPTPPDYSYVVQVPPGIAAAGQR